MRPRLTASVPGLENPSLSPYARFERFARMIVSVPKAEADKEMNKSGNSRLTARKKKRDA
jgi:hypothetical protein